MAVANEPAWAEMSYHERRLHLLNANKNQRTVQNRTESNPVDININIRTEQTQNFLSSDHLYNLAFSWGVHEGNFKKARDRGFTDEWILNQIKFVASRADVRKKGAYLCTILAYNRH